MTHTILRPLRNAFLLLAAFSLVTTGFSADKEKNKDKDPICGKWKWISGAVHQFGPNGRVVGEKGCTWKHVEGTTPPKYIVTWGTDYVDTLHLVENGNRLKGKNHEGNEVWGTRVEK